MSEYKPDHFSVSQLRTYRRCGQQYYYIYPEKMRMAPGISQIRGTSLHRTAAANHAQKIESKRDLPLDEMQCRAAEAVESEFAGGVSLTSQERTVGVANLRASTVDAAVKLTGLYALELAPTIRPIMSEKRLLLKPPADSPLDTPVEMQIDLAQEDDSLDDLKTSSKSPNASDAHKSDQLSTYSLGYQALTGRPASKLRLDHLVLTKAGNTKIVIQETTRGPKDHAAVLDTMARAIKGIRAGVFVPNTEGWWCSERYCGFHGICPFFKGGAEEE